MPHPFQCSLFLTSYVCYIFHIFITHVDYRHFDFLGLFLFVFFWYNIQKDVLIRRTRTNIYVHSVPKKIVMLMPPPPHGKQWE